jgi:hypothetical protein
LYSKDNKEEEGEESEEEIKKMRIVQREITRFCICILDHQLQDDEYKSVLISACAAMGIREDGGWLGAEEYTPKYSAIIKLARLMVIEEAYQSRQEKCIHIKRRYPDTSDEDIQLQIGSYLSRVRQMCEKFMTIARSSDPSPLEWIFRSRSYGLKIRYTTAAPGSIQWTGHVVACGKVRFHINQLKEMCVQLAEEARVELLSHLLMIQVDDRLKSKCIHFIVIFIVIIIIIILSEHIQTGLPDIHWDSLHDRASESRDGWSFLSNDNHKWEADKEWWMFERTLQEAELQKQFWNNGIVRTQAVAAYHARVERFEEMLLMLIHISGGQPARAPELLGMRWKNTKQGGIRNITIENGLVAFRAVYHKGYRSSGNIKTIHRYLPREVGELLVYHLWLVKPFLEKLEVHIHGFEERSAFIWGDGEKKEYRNWTGPKKLQREEVDREERSREERNREERNREERSREGTDREEADREEVTSTQ